MKGKWFYVAFVAVGLLIAYMALFHNEAQAAETDRQYIERVHSYAHGNSYYIQVLNKRSHETNAVVADQGSTIGNHEKRIKFLEDMNYLSQSEIIRNRNEMRSEVDRINEALDEVAEANAVALAISGHQFNTQGGFQTALSASTISGKQAVALGIGGAINERLFVNGAISTSGGTTGGVVSSTFAW